MSSAPCKDCPDRVLGCHTNCERYQALRAERQQIHDGRKQLIDSSKILRYYKDQHGRWRVRAK